MIRLIVNADDLGGSPARDRGILQAFQAGVVTSASLLAIGASSREAARAALSAGLPVGIHLNLSEGRSLTGSVPHLTSPSGEFPGKWETRRRLAAGLIEEQELAAEISAQIERVLAAGVTPDHLDTHQHLHLFPVVTRAVLLAADVFGISGLRLPVPAEPAAEDPGGTLGEELSLYRRLAPAARRAIGRAGVAAPDGLYGMPLLGRLDRVSLTACLRRLPPGTWELMVHPGYPDPADPFGGPEREEELAALCSPGVRCLLQDRGIVPISYRDLTCAS